MICALRGQMPPPEENGYVAEINPRVGYAAGGAFDTTATTSLGCPSLDLLI